MPSYMDFKYSRIGSEIRTDKYIGSAKSVNIPAQIEGLPVTSIGKQAFSECTNLTSITIPEGVTSIGDGAFYECKSLTSITIPEGVTSIGAGAFIGCSSLETIICSSKKYFLSTPFVYEQINFNDVRINSFIGKDSIITIPSIVDSFNVVSIGYLAFYGCRSLTSITISEGVTSIGAGVFYGCSLLESINIPEGVTSIGAGAFIGCGSLENIICSSKKYFLSTPFVYEQINFNDVRINSFIGKDSIITIPSIVDSFNVVSIGYLAFYGCRSLTSITIPEVVTSIGDSAFNDCKSLTSINIPKGVSYIGEETFRNCSSLKSIVIPEGVNEIGKKAFWNCKSLKSIAIPNSVTRIKFAAFSGCTNLEFVKIPNSVNSIGHNLFEGCDHLKWVYIKKSWNDKAINNIFGTEPSNKIFRMVGEVKQYLQETLNELNFDYYNEIAVLKNSLRSMNVSDNTIMDIVVPAVNALENLVPFQKQKNYFGRVIGLMNSVSSKKLTGADDYLQRQSQEKISMESDLKTNIIALLLLENKLFTKNALPNPDLTIVKEAAQVLSKLDISFRGASHES